MATRSCRFAPCGAPAIAAGWRKFDWRCCRSCGRRSELGGTADPGQHPRGAPNPTTLWSILDLTPAGSGADRYPKLNHGGAA
jgi:hypothetical protein